MKLKIEATLESERHDDLSRVMVDINRIIKEFNVNSEITIKLQHDGSTHQTRVDP